MLSAKRFNVEHNLSEEDVFRNQNEKGLEEVVYEVASHAYLHLKHARELHNKVDKETRIAFLNATVLSDYLDALQRVNFNVYHPSLNQRKGISLPIKLFWNKYKGRY